MAGSTSGGGISRGASVSAVASEGMRGFRRRWTSGVAVVTHRGEDGIRGVTVSGLVPIGIAPPSLAFVLQTEGSFHERLIVGTRVGISVLHRDQEFIAERFAGRAPVPDAQLSGIAHRSLDSAVILDDCIAAAAGWVRSREAIDDHLLIVIDVSSIDVPPDTDQPLVLYETAYRDLEPA